MKKIAILLAALSLVANLEYTENVSSTGSFEFSLFKSANATEESIETITVTGSVPPPEPSLGFFWGGGGSFSGGGGGPAGGAGGGGGAIPGADPNNPKETKAACEARLDKLLDTCVDATTYTGIGSGGICAAMGALGPIGWAGGLVCGGTVTLVTYEVTKACKSAIESAKKGQCK